MMIIDPNDDSDDDEMTSPPPMPSDEYQRGYRDGRNHEAVCNLIDRQNTASALNASAQRDAERKLLERAIEMVREAVYDRECAYCGLYTGRGSVNKVIHESIGCTGLAFLAEYAALQAEVSDG